MKHEMEDKSLPKDDYSGLAHHLISLTQGILSILDYTNQFHLLVARARMVHTEVHSLGHYIQCIKEPIQ